METSTRSIAKSMGLSTFFTGKPCKNGHISKRYTSNGACTACLSKNSKAHELEPQAIIEDTEKQIAAIMQQIEHVKQNAALRIAQAEAAQKASDSAAERAAIVKRNATAVRDLKAVMVPLHEFVELNDLKWARDTVRAAVHSRLPEGVEVPDSMLWSSKPPRGGLVYTFYVPADMYDEVKSTLMAKRADRPWQQCYFSVHPSREDAVASILYSFAFARDPAAKMQDVKVQHIAGFTVVATVHRDDVEAIREVLASPTSQAAHSWLDGDIDK